jgi:hypothetical protein
MRSSVKPNSNLSPQSPALATRCPTTKLNTKSNEHGSAGRKFLSHRIEVGSPCILPSSVPNRSCFRSILNERPPKTLRIFRQSLRRSSQAGDRETFGQARQMRTATLARAVHTCCLVLAGQLLYPQTLRSGDRRSRRTPVA